MTEKLPELTGSGNHSTAGMPTKRLVKSFAERYFNKAIKIMDRVSDNALGELAKPIQRIPFGHALSQAQKDLESGGKVREIQAELLGKLSSSMTSEEIRSADMVVRRVIPDLHVVVNEMTVNDEFTSKDTILDKLAGIFIKQPMLLTKIVDSEPALREQLVEHLQPKPVTIVNTESADT